MPAPEVDQEGGDLRVPPGEPEAEGTFEYTQADADQDAIDRRLEDRAFGREFEGLIGFEK